MTRTELLEHYLKPTDLAVKELIDRNAFAQIMQFAEAYHLEQLRIGGVSNSARYIIIEESTSSHCCFGYTIVDTKEGKESYGDYWKREMCETFEKQEAIEICTALNKHYC